jgi:hypothetical protein
MSTIVTRAGKGSQLSWNEVDANFTNLNTDKIQSSNAGSTGQVLTKTSGGAEWANAAGGGLQVAILQATTTNKTYTTFGSTVIYDANWTERSDINNLTTVSDDDFTITSAGTYIIEFECLENIYCDYTGTGQVTSPSITVFLTQGASTNITSWYSWENVDQNSTSTALTSILGRARMVTVQTIESSTSYRIRLLPQSGGSSPSITLARGIGPIIKITKIA